MSQLFSSIQGGPQTRMFKWTKLLSIMLAVLVLSLNTACQAADKKQEAAPAGQTPAASEPVKPPSTTADTDNTAATNHDISAVLVIKSVKISSPGRDTATVSPSTVNSSENNTVHARVWETLDFECIAADQAGHKLTYAWSCSSGKLRGDGSKVIWTAPGAGGDYNVSVNVTCDKGEKAALAINMAVKCCGN